MTTIKILGVDCYLQFGRYANKTIAMTAFNATTHEPHCVCTVNWEQNWRGEIPYEEAFKFPVVVIKNYSENYGVLEDLLSGDVIRDATSIYGADPFVKACFLTLEWQSIALDQISK